jgi:hypothetical protein
MIFAFTILAGLCNECNATVWELQFQGYPVAYHDMETIGECLALKEELDWQTPAWTALECVEVPVVRHNS